MLRKSPMRMSAVALVTDGSGTKPFAAITPFASNGSAVTENAVLP